MHGLISLYLGYAIYLVIFFRAKRRDPLYQKVTILLAIKLLILTALYFAFFDKKMSKEQRQTNIENLIINQK